MCEFKDNVAESDVIYVDKAGFSVEGEQYWVWMFVTEDKLLYMGDQSRGNQVLEDVLGEEFAEDAILSRDGWSTYPTYHRKLQRCRGHLLWEAEFVADQYDEAQ